MTWRDDHKPMKVSDPSQKIKIILFIIALGYFFWWSQAMLTAISQTVTNNNNMQFVR